MLDKDIEIKDLDEQEKRIRQHNKKEGERIKKGGYVNDKKNK